MRAAENGEDAIHLVREQRPGLIALDLMLPTIDGLAVFRAILSTDKTSDIPIVMLMSRGEESDIVRGFEAGADNYLTMRFSPKVLVARIHAAFRRSASTCEGVVEAFGVRLDPERHKVIATASGWA